MRKHLIPALAVLGIVAGLPACSSQEQWVHPQTGTAMLDRDLSDCSATARREWWRAPSTEAFQTTRYSGVDSYGRGAEEPAHRTARSPYVTEERIRDTCMQSKGYEIVKIDPAKEHASTEASAAQPTADKTALR